MQHAVICGQFSCSILVGDDSNKRHEERHVFDVHVHTWDSAKWHHVGLVFGNFLISGGSGKGQSEVKYHVNKKLF